MTKDLTVIMPFLNEREEPILTLKSLYASANHDDFEVIAIDDASNYPIEFSEFPETRVVRHTRRKGVDACRHEGVSMAETPYVLLLDAHMRFTDDDWFYRLLEHLERNRETLFCTTCLGLGYGVETMADSHIRYQGATLSLYSEEPPRTTDGTKKVGRDIIEGKWLPHEKWPVGKEPYDIACVMGANYAMSKRWYHHIHGVDGLQMWGSSEPFLSMKSWLAGGKVQCIPDIEIGHVFRDASPYGTECWRMTYNKFLMMSILFPPEVSAKLIEKLEQGHDFEMAYNVISRNNEWVSAEREYFDSIRKHDLHWYLEKFGIEIPA